MRQYKRNQVEEAISRLHAEIELKPSSDLRTRLKRLLNLDRSLGRGLRDPDPARANYAFYSANAPGKGMEVLFSEYEAFALSLGIRLLEGQWPQSFVVDTMRRSRPDLEREHRRILRLDEKVLFDVQLIQQQESGFYQGANSAPSFLLIVSDVGVSGQKRSSGPYPKIFKDHRAAFRFQLEEAGRSCTWCELVTPAWNLHRHLADSIPRQRGRTG